MDEFCARQLPDAAYEHRRLSALSKGVNANDETTNLQGQVNPAQVRGAHTVRGGIDLRKAMRGRMGGGNAAGLLTFTRDYTRQASDEAALTPSNLGLSLAAFLLGVPTTIQLDDQLDASLYNHYVGTFVQDSWRMTQNLTLNVGLRFEYEDGIREKDNRMLVGLTRCAHLDFSGGRGGVPGERRREHGGHAAEPRLRGGAVFATDPGQDGASWKGQAMWMPRFSAAYKIGSRMVVKAGYGLYYDTLNAAGTGPRPDRLQRHHDDREQLGSGSDAWGQPQHQRRGSLPSSRRWPAVRNAVGSSLGADSILGTVHA